MALKKKTVKRNTKKKAKRKPYFGKDAHNAIIQYQQSECNLNKNKIYTNQIRPSFEKLAENLIFIHGFSNSKETFSVLKSDCVTFLFEILQKFDGSKGTKAFSYFNVCAKNFLIIQTKKKNKNRSRSVCIHDENLSITDKQSIENHQVVDSQESTIIKKEDKGLMIDMIQSIKNKVTSHNEKCCLIAIETLFKNINDLDYLNKRAIFVYLRELSGLNAKQLSVSMSNIRKIYKDIKKNNYLFNFLDDY